mgnify:CR=1 FL=1
MTGALPYFITNGVLTLNGPHVSGYGAMTKVNGADVMVLATDPEVAAGIAAYINEKDATSAAHVVMGQPPWYQNLTKDNTLQDLLEKKGTPMETWERLGRPRRVGLIP